MTFVFSVSKWLCGVAAVVFLVACGDSDSSDSGQAGVSGSKAQLIMLDDAIYSLASNKLIRVDVSNVSQSQVTDEIVLDFDAETLTTDGDAIFIGSPGEVRTYQYANEQLDFIDTSVRVIPGKDPVVTDGEFAYSTVVTREWNASSDISETSMRGDGDLYIYDIDAANNITELAFYPNIGYVQGLALWDKNLLVCDPADGLMQLDVTDPFLIDKVQQFSFVLCEDILHLGGGHFATVGEDGIYQLVSYGVNKLAVISLIN